MFLKKFLILIDRVFLRSSLSKFNSKLVKNKLEKNLNYRITVRYNKSDKNLFTELCDFYGSDKGSQGSNLVYPWPAHTYSDFYSTIFSNFRSSVKKVYENGIGTNNINLTSNMSSTGIPGASLRVWRDYFPNSIVIGTDIDRDILFQEERIKTFFIDQTNEQIIQHFWNECGEDNFDLIVDDGLHIASAGKTLFMNSIKYLSDSGLYIIEDIGLKDLIVYEDFFKRTNYLVNYVSLFRPGLDNRNNNLITIRKTS